jgi:hypothetical protein
MNEEIYFYNDYQQITDEELDKSIKKANESFAKLGKKIVKNKNKIVKSVYLTKFSFLALLLAVNFITYLSYSNMKRITYY